MWWRIRRDSPPPCGRGKGRLGSLRHPRRFQSPASVTSTFPPSPSLPVHFQACSANPSFLRNASQGGPRWHDPIHLQSALGPPWVFQGMHRIQFLRISKYSVRVLMPNPKSSLYGKISDREARGGNIIGTGQNASETYNINPSSHPLVDGLLGLIDKPKL